MITRFRVILSEGDPMTTCTFFGHRDTPETVEPLLRTTLLDLINNIHVTLFYVGNNGNFDRMVKNTLKLLKLAYPQIQYAVILAYKPRENNPWDLANRSPTIFPDALENTPPKAAIPRRNQWMLDRSDYVITYITRTWGNAAQFKKLAEKKGKVVLNLAEYTV